jgi:hypothetical protein
MHWTFKRQVISSRLISAGKDETYGKSLKFTVKHSVGIEFFGLQSGEYLKAE